MLIGYDPGSGGLSGTSGAISGVAEDLEAEAKRLIAEIESGNLDVVKESVRLLQKALRSFAYHRQNSALDPCQYDGTMNMGTMIAIYNAANELLGMLDLPSPIGDLLGLVDTILHWIENIPLVGQVTQFILSPWLIDPVLDLVLGILDLIPGVPVSDIKNGISAMESAISLASPAMALALLGAKLVTPQVPPGSGGLSGPLLPHSGNVILGALTKYDPQVHGLLMKDALSGCLARTEAQETAPYVLPPYPRPPIARWLALGGFGLVTYDKPYYIEGWGPPDVWEASDLDAWNKNKTHNMIRSDLTYWYVDQGEMPFISFFVSRPDGSKFRLGIFYNKYTTKLRIEKWNHESLGAWLSDAVGDLWDIAKDIGGFLCGAVGADDDCFEKLYDFVKKWGCAIVNSEIIVQCVSLGASLVATPATGLAIEAAAHVGQAACAVLDITEALIAILRLLASPHRDPPDLSGEDAPESKPDSLRALAPNILSLLHKGTAAGPAQSAGKWLIPPPSKLTNKKVATKGYPAGSIGLWHRDLQVWLIFSPPAATPSTPAALGEGVNPTGVPSTYTQTGTENALPKTVRNGGETGYPFYRKWWFWALVGAGAVGATATVLVVKRRKAKKALGRLEEVKQLGGRRLDGAVFLKNTSPNYWTDGRWTITRIPLKKGSYHFRASDMYHEWSTDAETWEEVVAALERRAKAVAKIEKPATLGAATQLGARPHYIDSEGKMHVGHSGGGIRSDVLQLRRRIKRAIGRMVRTSPPKGSSMPPVALEYLTLEEVSALRAEGLVVESMAHAGHGEGLFTVTEKGRYY